MMTRDRLEELFAITYPFGEHDKLRAEDPSAMQRLDLRVFLLIDELLPGRTTDIVSDAQHDQIWLDADLDELAKVITEDQVRILNVCGCFIDEDGLSMHA